MSVSEQIDNINEKMNWHWRNSMRIVRFFAFDSRAALPVCILLFRLADPKMWLLVAVNLFFFRYLENKGLTVPAALRNFRQWLVGADRTGWLHVHNRKFKDFG